MLTDLLDGKGDVSLHGKFNRWLLHIYAHLGVSEARDLQARWDVPSSDLFVQLLDNLVTWCPGAKSLIVHDA